MALDDLRSVTELEGWVFFDRSWIDAASALENLTGEQILAPLGQVHRYHRRVFLTPPWQEIYAVDAERRHGLGAALAEYSRLLETYPGLGYEVCVLPKVNVMQRAEFVLNRLGMPKELSA